MKSDLASLRNEFTKDSLDEKSITRNPFDQFAKWFEEAKVSEIIEPNAMVLGTFDAHKQPHQRTVLLKGFDALGFTFYTNYDSKKGKHMEVNPQVSLLFPWFLLQRQVIVCGSVEKVSREESKTYFHSRPKGSQIGAYISNQSEKLTSREELEKKLTEATERFENQEIPLPDNWGGYLVKPTSFEFWQGRANRLHDRIFFEQADADWEISRLSP